MSTVELHTIPEDTLLRNDGTFLCVFDEENNLVADYDFCTGLRLLQTDDGLSIYVNDSDLVPGTWSLFVTYLGESVEPETVKVKGVKEGSPVERELVSEFPWNDCGPGVRVSKDERQRRLSTCLSCPLLDRDSMMCTASGKSVLDATTREDQYCPEDYWGNKQSVLDTVSAHALESGLVTPRVGPSFEANEQAQFESELDLFLEGMS